MLGFDSGALAGCPILAVCFATHCLSLRLKRRKFMGVFDVTTCDGGKGPIIKQKQKTKPINPKNPYKITPELH